MEKSGVRWVVALFAVAFAGRRDFVFSVSGHRRKLIVSRCHSKPSARAVPVGAQFVPPSVVRSLNVSFVFVFFQIVHEAVVKLLDDSHK